MTTAPVTVPLDGLPAHVEIYEVGARDGLQNESTILPVAVKLAFIQRLVGCGLRTVEATSLVRPDRVPALADAEELLDLLLQLADLAQAFRAQRGCPLLGLADDLLCA